MWTLKKIQTPNRDRCGGVEETWRPCLCHRQRFAACDERDRTPFGAACSDLKAQGISPLLGKASTFALARCTDAEEQLWSWELEALQCGWNMAVDGVVGVQSSARG